MISDTERMIAIAEGTLMGIGDFLDDKSIQTSLDVAIEALKSKSEAEKYRTPNKVYLVNTRQRAHILYCPQCKNEINRFDGYRYCPYCGQALDWSEVDE